jgi:hypothetical protein
MGHMGQVGTEAGGVTYRAGKFGKGVQIAEATTNLVVNPSFENGLTGWVNYVTGGSIGTREVSAIRVRSGASALRMEQTGGGGVGHAFGVVSFANMTSGQTYTASAWLYVESLTQGSVSLAAYDSASVGSASSVSVAGIDWVRVEVTISATASGTGSVYVYFNNGRGTVYVDDIQVEQKAYATPYCDGSLGMGHSWIGTAHASASTRTAAAITYDTGTLLSPTAITAGCWVRRSNAQPGFILAHPSVHIEFL